jgi:ketosteroid isomerase-like protein
LYDDSAGPAPIHPAAPADPTAQLQWLVDRAQISDLLVEFARALDARDWEANISLYLPGGVFMVGDVLRVEGQEAMRRNIDSDSGLTQYHGTWHLSANHAIEITGDTARTRSYLLGIHRLDDDSYHHADGGGWYDCTLRRTSEGWRFATVRIHEVWHSGAQLPHVERPAAD